MSVAEILIVSGICFCFYMLGRLHESIISFRKQIEDIYKNVG